MTVPVYDALFRKGKERGLVVGWLAFGFPHGMILGVTIGMIIDRIYIARNIRKGREASSQLVAVIGGRVLYPTWAIVMIACAAFNTSTYWLARSDSPVWEMLWWLTAPLVGMLTPFDQAARYVGTALDGSGGPEPSVWMPYILGSTCLFAVIGGIFIALQYFRLLGSGWNSWPLVHAVPFGPAVGPRDVTRNLRWTVMALLAVLLGVAILTGQGGPTLNNFAVAVDYSLFGMRIEVIDLTKSAFYQNVVRHFVFADYGVTAAVTAIMAINFVLSRIFVALIRVLYGPPPPIESRDPRVLDSRD